jgi:hypothetical protein
LDLVSYLILKNTIKGLDYLCRLPPLRLLDHVRNSCRSGTSLRLNLAYWPEPTGRESLLELTGHTVVGVVVRSKRHKNSLPILVPLLFGGYTPGRRCRTVQVVDVPVDPL